MTIFLKEYVGNLLINNKEVKTKNNKNNKNKTIGIIHIHNILKSNIT